jgi:hypothetical protein
MRDGYGELIRELTEEAEQRSDPVQAAVERYGFERAVKRCRAAGVTLVSTKAQFGERRWYHRKRGRLFGPFAERRDAWIDAVRVHGVRLD